MRWRWAIGVAHRHVDDIFAAMTSRHFEFGRNIENIGRQTLNSGKPLHHASLLGLGKSALRTK
jgi:hypothetical protein